MGTERSLQRVQQEWFCLDRSVRKSVARYSVRMPIEVFGEVQAVSNEEFHRLDEQFLGIVYDIHNEYGRFLKEPLYQEEIAHRARRHGLTVAREFRIRVSHHSFVKDYFVDLLVNGGVPVETKVVDSLAKTHDAQLLNYIFLLGVQHGSLINIRPPKVERRFVSTTLTPAARKQFQIQEIEWKEPTEEFTRFRTILSDLLNDWGAFLDFRLYWESLVHLLGGEDKVVRKQTVFAGERIVGQQAVHHLGDDHAFSISAIKSGHNNMIAHFRRFLRHTELRAMAWANLNGGNIEFTTIPSE